MKLMAKEPKGTFDFTLDSENGIGVQFVGATMLLLQGYLT